MSRRRPSLQPGAAPALVLKYLERKPDARPTELAIALGIKRSTIEMAIWRLVEMGLYDRPKRAPRQLTPKQSSPSPTASLNLVRQQFSAAAAVGPTLRSDSNPAVHPTGTPFTVVNGALRASSGAVMAITIIGTHFKAGG